MIPENTRVCFPVRCWYCKGWAYFFQDDNNGRRLFQRLGRPWLEHDCPENPREWLEEEEVQKYRLTPGREKEWIDARSKELARNYKATGFLPREIHINAQGAKVLGEIEVEGFRYNKVQVRMIKAEKVNLWVRSSIVNVIRTLPIAHARLKKMRRGIDKYVFIDNLVPFLNEGGGWSGMAPDRDLNSSEMVFRKTRKLQP